MGQTNLNIRMDEDLKKQFEQFCSDVGMNMTTAITVFAKQATLEQRIPFEITADPFYSKPNMNYISEVISDIDSGRSKLAAHELIEVE